MTWGLSRVIRRALEESMTWLCAWLRLQLNGGSSDSCAVVRAKVMNYLISKWGADSREIAFLENFFMSSANREVPSSPCRFS